MGLIQEQGKTTPCPGVDPCEHTDAEHNAFDQGAEHGWAGLSDEACPFLDGGFREAWLSGHSVGFLDYKAVQAQAER